MSSHHDEPVHLEDLRDLLQRIKQLCDELRQLRFVPWPAGKEWQAADASLAQARSRNLASRQAIDACLEMLDQGKHSLPVQWLTTDEGQSKLIQLRNGLRTLREDLKEHVAGTRGYQMPMGDRFGSGPPAAPAEHVKRWDDAEMCVCQLGDALDDYIFNASAPTNTEAEDGATTPSHQPKGGSRGQPKETPLGRGGISWQDALERAEKHVKDHDGALPSVKKLAEITGCSRRTMDKAISRSRYLQARKREAEAKRSGRTVPLSDAALEEASQREENELAGLIAEQEADQAREQRQQLAARRR